jgi:hypothetical protein
MATLVRSPDAFFALYDDDSIFSSRAFVLPDVEVRRSRRTDTCACGKPKQRRSQRCASCSAKATNAARKVARYAS